MGGDASAASFKFVQNCEARLFQRPDDAIHRGYDKQTELDFSRPGNFFSNFEPLTHEEVLAAGAEAGPRLARVIRRFVADLGMLIGRQNETLSALEFITRLMTNQQTHTRTGFVARSSSRRDGVSSLISGGRSSSWSALARRGCYSAA